MSRRLSPVQRYIHENVFCRCGQAVTRLAARALREAGEPVVQFCELHLWGRTQAPGALQDDPALARAAQPKEPPLPTA